MIEHSSLPERTRAGLPQHLLSRTLFCRLFCDEQVDVLLISPRHEFASVLLQDWTVNGSNQTCRVGQNHTYIYIYTVCIW